jgi:CubicO group peptidase (beta-lactamase class C family)
MKLKYGTPEEAGMIPKRVDMIRNLCARWVEQKTFPAIVALAAHKGIVVLHEAYGKQGPEPNSPAVELDSIFPLASMTKIVTAAVAMSLAEDGLLGLHLPLRYYIPELTGGNTDKVMVHHLLTHTSGYTDESVYKDKDLERYIARKTIDNKEIESKFSQDSLQHPMIAEYISKNYNTPLLNLPGIEMYYADFNYVLLGEIIVRISGKSLNDIAKEKILDPLGMKDSYYETPESLKSRIVRRPSDFPYARWMDYWIGLPLGSDGLISTAMDMAIFGQMCLNCGTYGNERILCHESIQKMTTNQIPGIGARLGDEVFPEGNWGLGFGIKWFDGKTLQSSKAYSHGGAGIVYLWIDPAYDIVGAFFTVSSEGAWIYREAGLFVNAVTSAVENI